jgi:hypothetical protein
MLMLAAEVFAQDGSFPTLTGPLIAPPAPATAPATQPAATIQTWFDDLANSEPAVRDSARTSLMGLNRADLDALREVVRRSVPLAPAQSAILQDIVTHVYLSGDVAEDERGATGFLGVMLDPPENGVQPSIETSGAGVFIFKCMPGFCGYRWLRPGDVVRGVVVDGDVMRVTEKDRLIELVSATAPGSPLRLQVLRQGQVIELSVRVDAKPLLPAGQPLRVDEWQNRRAERAKAYWDNTFAPILGQMT